MKRPFSSFILRCIAAFTMTLDHVAKMIQVFLTPTGGLAITCNVLSIIGRIAYPVFLFLLVEGFVYTKNLKKYMLRMGIMAAIIYVGFVGATFVVGDGISYILIYLGNIFIDLLLFLVFFCFIFHENKKLRWLSILPFIYNLLILLIQNFYIPYFTGLALNLTAGLFAQYAVLNVFIFPLYPALYYLVSFIQKKIRHSEESIPSFKNSSFNIRIIVFAILVTILGVLCHVFTYFPKLFIAINFVTQTYMLIALPFILLYNGKKGFSNKISQIAFYLYYPLHLVIIFSVVYLISL